MKKAKKMSPPQLQTRSLPKIPSFYMVFKKTNRLMIPGNFENLTGLMVEKSSRHSAHNSVEYL